MDIEKKLKILADSAKYDASCSSSGSKRANIVYGKPYLKQLLSKKELI